MAGRGAGHKKEPLDFFFLPSPLHQAKKAGINPAPTNKAIVPYSIRNGISR
jgi:hypothetical protein